MMMMMMMMLRPRCVNLCLRRLLHGGAVSKDVVLEQLRVCPAENQVFEVVGKNKAKLTVEHVSCAVGMLWQFQKEKHQLLRTIELTKSHPQFITVCVLAENKIALMDDIMLVDMLYAVLRLNVEPHDSLVQQLVSEAWLRVDRLPMTALSKFAVCLNDQYLQHSPLMGHITSIVDQKLSTIDNLRVLTALMISVSPLVSLRLRDALINRAYHLLLTMHASKENVPRKLLQFLRSVKYIHQPLLEKCSEILLRNVSMLDAENISIILSLHQSLQFNNFDFRLAARQRLIELMESCTDPISFTRLFVSLAPMAGPDIRQELENTLLMLADELNSHQALAIVEALEVIQSRNLTLLTKIVSVIQKHLHVYKLMDVTRVTQALALLRYQNPEFRAKLRDLLVKYLQSSFIPSEVTMLTRVLSMLPCPRLEDSVVSRINAVVSQCTLNELNTIAVAVARWVRNDTSYRHNTPGKYVRLLQTLNRCGHERLQMADQLDVVLEQVKHISGEWFEEMVVEETLVTLQRMIEQINWTHVPELAAYLTRINYLCPPLMDRIASVAIKDIDKIHYSGTYATLLPFSVLNYDPVQVDELYEACIRSFSPHLSSFDPHLLVLLGYSLALADRFPEELVKEIFSIGFLGKLDSQLETLSDVSNLRTRMRLMELNRAVCLECPEFQVPWFHDRYCQHLQRKGTGHISPVQQQIHKMLGEVLGGIHCVQVAVVTPYFYTIDFECKLDRNLQPLMYSEPSTLPMLDRGKISWDVNTMENIRDELPPGAQRIAVDFLDSKSFCKNWHHVRGEALMRKRHLEILGYRVVQIPHFEWNSMELSTHDAWKDYLKKKIIG